MHRRRILLAHHDIHAYGPMPVIGDRTAFYGILLGHQHCQLIRKLDVGRRRLSMIRQSVGRNLDAELLQSCEELLRMAYAGDRMDPRSLESFHRTRLAADQRSRLDEACASLNRRSDR
jgi:hypothetical protein